MKRYIEPLIHDQALPWLHFDGSEKWKKELISEILLGIISNAGKSRIRATEKMLRTESRIKRMLQYISENLAEELRVDDIAENAMISKSECTRCFHENLGIAPIQYIKQLRIDTAASQLRLTDRAVSEIACECGFQDMSYFAKTFKNIKGVTPSEYRDA